MLGVSRASALRVVRGLGVSQPRHVRQVRGSVRVSAHLMRYVKQIFVPEEYKELQTSILTKLRGGVGNAIEELKGG